MSGSHKMTALYPILGTRLQAKMHLPNSSMKLETSGVNLAPKPCSASLVWCSTPKTPEKTAANRTYATVFPISSGLVDPEINTASSSANRNSTTIVNRPQTKS